MINSLQRERTVSSALCRARPAAGSTDNSNEFFIFYLFLKKKEGEKKKLEILLVIRNYMFSEGI